MSRAKSKKLQPSAESRKALTVVELILLIIYSVIVWLIFFKFKWLPWNRPPGHRHRRSGRRARSP